MGQVLQTYIQHQLEPAQIVDLPEVLSLCPVEAFRGKWEWTCSRHGGEEMTVSRLLDVMRRPYTRFLENTWSAADLNSLENEKNWSIDFTSRRIAILSFGIKSKQIWENEDLLSEIRKLSSDFCEFISGIDLLITEEGGAEQSFDADLDEVRRSLVQKGWPLF